MATPGIPSQANNKDVGIPEAEAVPKGWVDLGGSAAHGPGLIVAHTFNIPWGPNGGNVVAHIKKSLGYSFVDGAGTLVRYLPRQHPTFPWLRATRLIRFEGGIQSGHNADVSNYRLAKLTYTFESLPYKLKGTAGQEWTRFVIIRRKTAGEMYSRDGYTWKFTEGNPPTGPTVGAEFPGVLAIPLSKTRLAWTWVQVPEAYICDANGTPTKMDARVNTINSAQFAGFEAQTLLFEGYDLEARMDPTDPTGLAVDGNVPRTFDVTLYFNRFKPPKGGADEGWNNDPGPDFLWYKTHAYNGATDTGSTKFTTSDFTQLFAHV